MSASTASASSPRPSHDNACARTKFGFRSRSGVDCRFRESIGEGQVRQPDGAVRCPDEQVGVGCQVGVETQTSRGARRLVCRRGHWTAASSVATSPRSRRSRAVRRAPAAYLPVQRMRHPHLDAAAGGLERDEATGFGLLDRGCIGDPRQGREFDRLADGQHVDHIADRRGQVPDAGFDQLDQAGRHRSDHRSTASTRARMHNSAVGDLLLDDVPQIQSIAASQLP